MRSGSGAPPGTRVLAGVRSLRPTASTASPTFRQTDDRLAPSQQPRGADVGRRRGSRAARRHPCPQASGPTAARPTSVAPCRAPSSVSTPPTGGARPAFVAVRHDLQVPDTFPPEVLAEAEAAAKAPRLPDLDLTAIAFATLDPPGSTDLDQAYAIERRDAGYRVRYAIADVAAFVRPGEPVDLEAHRRVETLYAPDGRVPLHPPVLSEGAASLLPGSAAAGAGLDPRPRRARRAGRHRRTAGRGTQPRAAGLPDGAGPARRRAPRPSASSCCARSGCCGSELERARGGMSLNTPEQEVVPRRRGWALRFRAACRSRTGTRRSRCSPAWPRPAHARGHVGVLRTMPPADPRDVDAAAPGGARPRPRLAARSRLRELLRDARPDRGPATPRSSPRRPRLFRGAAYTAFDGAPPDGASTRRSLRRTRTAPRRCGGSSTGTSARCALALCAGVAVPGWARTALPALPEEMAEGIRRGNQLDRADIDLVEAAVLAPAVGQVFAGRGRRPRPPARRWRPSSSLDPAVLARCEARKAVPLGEPIRVRLRRRPTSRPGRCGSSSPAEVWLSAGRLRHRYPVRTADEPAGRPRRRQAMASPRNVRAPQGKVVGNAHPG